MVGNSTEIYICYHCGNKVPISLIGTHKGQELYEQIDGQRYNQDFECYVYQCPTCKGISIYGDFVEYPKSDDENRKRIYPKGSQLVPAVHKVASRECIPQKIVSIYDEIWPLRHIAPNAFAGQIRRVLEYICQEQSAEGNTLFAKLKHLLDSGVFPGHFAEMTDLIRKVGNIGAHSSGKEVDFHDAELLDDFFKSVVEYVYIAPSKIERLRRRIRDDENS